MEGNRQKWLDITKGIAITLVVFQHACGSLYKSGIYADESLLDIISFIGTFHMLLFMILSGYCFSLVYYKDGCLRLEKAAKQVLNLCILYVMYSILRYVFKLFLRSQVNEMIDKKAILLILIEPIDELWYLWTLIILYLIAIALIRFGKEKAIKIFAILSVMSVIYNVIGGSLPFSFDRVGRYLLWFNCGILSQKFYDTKKRVKIPKTILEVVAVSILYVVYYLLILPDFIVTTVTVGISLGMSDLCTKIGIILANKHKNGGDCTISWKAYA